MLPLYFPRVEYTQSLQPEGAEKLSLKEVCERAGVACRASGKWVNRPIFLSFDQHNEKILAEGTHSYHAVHIVCKHRDPVEQAKWALGALAYSTLFDGVARASIKCAHWKNIQ